MTLKKKKKATSRVPKHTESLYTKRLQQNAAKSNLDKCNLNKKMDKRPATDWDNSLIEQCNYHHWQLHKWDVFKMHHQSNHEIKTGQFKAYHHWEVKSFGILGAQVPTKALATGISKMMRRNT